ncbi:hypothetical protein E4U21_004494 [Claviceps maximensis]|nr:hypothetical protein E4U21_004494 [Claviceps maximensis]
MQDARSDGIESMSPHHSQYLQMPPQPARVQGPLTESRIRAMTATAGEPLKVFSVPIQGECEFERIGRNPYHPERSPTLPMELSAWGAQESADLDPGTGDIQLEHDDEVADALPVAYGM